MGMIKHLKYVASLAGMAGLSACTMAAESSAYAEASDSNGVRIVESLRPLWTDGEAWSVAAEPTQTIGVLNGPEEYQLVDVTAAARQSDGDFVVVDRGARAVRLFDAQGTFVRTLGGPGSGPGEFTSPDRVMITAGDSVAVWDSQLFRITRFDAEGELAGVHTVDLAAIAKAVEPPLYPATVEPLRDGAFLVRLVEKIVRKGGFPSGAFRDRSGALRVSADFSEVDTLMFFGATEQIAVEAPWGELPMPPALARTTRITHQGNPTRICIGEQEAPEIECFDPDGSRTRLRWRSDPPPVTGEEIAAWREETVDLYGQKLAEDDVIRALALIPDPAVRPDYSRITLDSSQNLWVEVGPTRERGSASIDYLVFDPTGALLGMVPLPPIEVMEIGDDFVMGVYRDEMEVEYLQLFELYRRSN